MRQTLEKVQGCKERLTELHHHCELITTYVILQDGIDGSQLDITPLKNRVDELNDVVQTYAQKTRCRAYLHFFLWGDDIDSLKRGIDTVVCVMGLAASARAAIADEDWTKRFAHLVSDKVLRVRDTTLNFDQHKRIIVSFQSPRWSANHRFTSTVNLAPVGNKREFSVTVIDLAFISRTTVEHGRRSDGFASTTPTL